MKLRYPITDLPSLRSEREFFLRCRATMSHAETFANRRSLYAGIDSQLEFNAKLIRQAELETLGHLATAGAWLT